MKKLFGLILLVMFCQINIVFAGSNVYYVSCETGDNKNPGTIDKPLKTIQMALDMSKASDIIYIRQGIYNEQLTIKTSGTKEHPIIIRNYQDEHPIVDGTNKSTRNEAWGVALLSIINKSYIEIDGIEFRNLSTTDEKKVVHGISVVGYGEGLTIRNCKVHDIKNNNTTDGANGHGISVYGSNPDKSICNIIIDNNEVYNCKLGTSESVVLNGNVTNFAVTNNVVHDNDNIGIDFIGYEGVAGPGEQDSARDGVCTDNYVYNITSKDNHVYHGYTAADAIYVDGGRNITIERNRVDKCDIGIAASSEHKNGYADNIIIRNNLVTNCMGYAGITFGGASTNNGIATNTKIYNNTVYNCKSGIIVQNAHSETNEVKNNIVYKCTRAIVGDVYGNDFLNNLTDDPSFVDEDGDDFRLSRQSCAIDKGIDVEYGYYDLDKNQRVYNKVDIGCYEYVGEVATEQPIPQQKYQITIDGLCNDWEDIDCMRTQRSGALRDLKAYNDNEYLYICVIGKDLDAYPNAQLLMNVDDNTTTGYSKNGIDYLVENGKLYKYAKAYGDDWNFEYVGAISGYKKASTCIEYKIKLDSIGNLSNNLMIRVSVLNKNWGNEYQIPKTGLSIFKM